MKLSKDFHLKEFAVSRTHPELVVPVPAEYIPNYQQLVETVLQPMRDKLGTAIIVTSGYRNAELNAAVGGSPTSQHMVGEAADITCAYPLWMMIAFMSAGLPHGQCIYYTERNFIHIALPSHKHPVQRFQIAKPGVKKLIEVKTIQDLAVTA